MVLPDAHCDVSDYTGGDLVYLTFDEVFSPGATLDAGTFVGDTNYDHR